MGAGNAQLVLSPVIVGCQVGHSERPIKQIGTRELAVHRPRFELMFFQAQGRACPVDRCAAHGFDRPSRQIGKVLGDTPGARSCALVEPGDFVKHRPFVVLKILDFNALAGLKQDHLDPLLAQLIGQGPAASTGANNDHYAIILQLVLGHVPLLFSCFLSLVLWQPPDIVKAAVEIPAEPP